MSGILHLTPPRGSRCQAVTVENGPTGRPRRVMCRERALPNSSFCQGCRLLAVARVAAIAAKTGSGK